MHLFYSALLCYGLAMSCSWQSIKQEGWGRLG
ncbi:MAG: hypothetical protein RJA39_861, partial [Pseudomonadota bacterium]